MVRWWPLGTVERRHSYTFGCGPARYSATQLVQLARSVIDAHDGRIVREQPDHVIERAIVGNSQRADERRPRFFRFGDDGYVNQQRSPPFPNLRLQDGRDQYFLSR